MKPKIGRVVDVVRSSGSVSSLTFTRSERRMKGNIGQLVDGKEGKERGEEMDLEWKYGG
jgi:hypothetical protein